MTRSRMSGKIGAGLDPCAASRFWSTSRQERSVRWCSRWAPAGNVEEARQLAGRFRGPDAARGALEGVWQYWKHTLGAVNVETPDASLNVLANGWLLYQTLSCRLWARSGYYQSGGAFGFRDQLQDAMALVHAEPRLLREHLLLCASRQFREGDVQHWWHPPEGRGVRTHCSDDYLWLPLATCRYVTCHRRYRRARRDRPLSGRAAGECRRGLLLRHAGALRRDCEPVRALHASHRARPAVRRARVAADGFRRLERRHEPGRRSTEKAKASGWASSCSMCCANSAALADARGDQEFAERCREEGGAPQ